MPTEYLSTPTSLGALDDAIRQGMALLEPPPELTISEWSDLNARLPRESSAQPGQWITATAEYQRGLMDAISDPAIERIVVQWPAQTGKSATLLNVIGYFVHQDASPILMVQPTLETAENFSKDRIATMIRDTPVLTSLFGDPRTRDSGNTLLHKQFPGGFLALAGANSPAGLASRPIRIVLLDEVDKYEASAGTEGDPVKLAEARTTTFWNRKVILTSTPSIKGASRIERELEKSDMRKFFVCCPHCDEEQILEWENLKWPSPKNDKTLTEPRPDLCYYVCGASGCEITESDKPDMVRQGVWRATKKSIDGKTAGFQMNSLTSPWVSWEELIRKWLDAQGSITELQTFVNASLAETWEVKGDRVEKEIFNDRKHAYPAEAPEGVLLVTAGGDVQQDRIEMTAVGWGIGEESWALDHQVFQGDPSQSDVWAEVDQWLRREFTHESGVKLRIRCAMIDSAGHHTKQVYAFTKPRERRRIYACVGRAGKKPMLNRPSRNNSAKALLYTVGVDTAKESFYARLKVEEEGPGFCHFPEAPQFDEEFFAQLTAEQQITTKKHGMDVRVWRKRRDRNEALDLRVYAMAALERMRANFPMLGKKVKQRVAERLQKQKEADEAPPEEEPGVEETYEKEQERIRAANEVEARRQKKILQKLSPKRRNKGFVSSW